MQFHLNGYRPGDPDISDAARQRTARADTVPERVDVLIVGCGPTGLTLASQLAAFPDIETCIVDQKGGRLQAGQADGIACRTMEMFEAFGFSGRVLREAYWVNEMSFWKPGRRAARRHRPGRPDPGHGGGAVRVPACDPQSGAGARLLPRDDGERPRGDRAVLRAELPRPQPGNRKQRRSGAARDGQARAERRRGGDGAGPLRGGLRRRAEPRPPRARPCPLRRLRQPGLGRDGCARRHRLPRHPPQIGDPLGQRRERPDHPARGRLPRADVYRARQARAGRAGRRPQHHRRPADRDRAARAPALHARGEGGRVVVGLRDRPAADRQVRRRAGGRGGGAGAARVHRRRRLPHAQPEGRPGHERLHAGRLQPGLEARLGAKRAVRAAPPAHLLGGAPGDRQRADRFRPRVREDVQRRAESRGRRGRGRHRPGGVPAPLRHAGPLHRGNGDALPAVAHHRRADVSALSRKGS